MTFSNIVVLFGQFDTDAVIEYTLNIEFNIEGGQELLYDEIHMITSADIESENDVVLIKILNNKIDTDPKWGKKTMPTRN